MLLGHLDVVEAKREDWQRDPFRLVEENGYLYARSAADMKAILREPPDAEAIARLSAASPLNNSTFRTTCVATTLDAGHATNALPQRARATVNCRILPGESVPEVQQTLARVLADDKIRITPTHESTLSPPPPLSPEIIGPMEKVSEQMWPGVPVVPTLLAGATDGRFTINAGIPTYGVSGMFAIPTGRACTA